MKDNEFYEYYIADTVMDKPLEFKIAQKRFCIYPPSLGKNYIIQRIVKEIGINRDYVLINPFLEAMRLCKEKKEMVARLIAIGTIKRKERLLNEAFINKRTEFFLRNLDKDDMSKLLLYILTNDRTEESIKYLGLEKEREEQKRVLKIKNRNSNVISFGGRSVYGSLIDAACERYGWTMDYVVWGISYANLRMLMADMITTISLTDEEKKKARLKTRDYIDGDNPENIDRIRAMFSD